MRVDSKLLAHSRVSVDVIASGIGMALSKTEMTRRIKGRNTSPEIAVRRLLHAAGYRFRLHRNDLPGRPDIVLPGRRAVILVHGCFWHQHSCKLGRTPKGNQSYWVPKLARNAERDKAVRRELVFQMTSRCPCAVELT
jgi:DNA mismatch endonuclease (patch repair protein)